MTHLSDTEWRQATLTLQRGGLGLRDPTIIGPAARLAATVNTAERAKDIGADDAFLESEERKALTTYMGQLSTVLHPILSPVKTSLPS